MEGIMDAYWLRAAIIAKGLAAKPGKRAAPEGKK
jgi:hypothetical protein